MLTRKYYTMIAKAINNSYDKLDIIDKLADEFKKDNPNFDRNRFENACSNGG